MDELPAKILEKASDSPIMLAIIAIIGGVFAIPKIRSYFAVEGASESIRKELGDLLTHERARVKELVAALDEARDEVDALRKVASDTLLAMSSLRGELLAFTRMHRSMRAAMAHAVTSGDTTSLRIWLELNPDENNPAPTPTP